MNDGNTPKETILIVDDAPSTINVLKTDLNHAGYRVLAATNGKSALDIVSETKPDLILMDVNMPGMNGYDTCESIKQKPEYRDIPVIFLSGLTDTLDKVKAFSSGAVDYMEKPAPAEELLARVKAQLSIRRMQIELERSNIALKQEIESRIRAQREVEEINATLERRVMERTAELQAANEQLNAEIHERQAIENTLTLARTKLNVLNNLIFSDIQNFLFINNSYFELIRNLIRDSPVINQFDKIKPTMDRISRSLERAKSFQKLGLSPPCWMNVNNTVLMALSHFDTLKMKKTIDLKGLEIYADPLLEQVFIQLIENTFQFSGSDPVEISLEYSSGTDHLTIIYADSGRGIPAAKKEDILNRTERGSGLILAREILSITGISIRETGKEGEGVRFEMTVPQGKYHYG